MAEAAEERHASRARAGRPQPPWARCLEWRLVARLRIPAPAAGILLFLTLLGAYAGMEWLGGGPDAEGVRWLGLFTESELGFAIASAVAGYALAAGAVIAAGNRAHVAELHASELQAGAPLRGGRVAGAVGLLGGLVFALSVDLAARDVLRARSFSGDGLLSLLVIGLAFWLAMRAAWFTVDGLATVARAVEHELPIDPLDSARLAPLGRMALRAAVLWVGAAVLSLFSIVLTDGSPAEFLVLGFLLLVAVGAFVIPVRGIHRRLREEKRRELARLRAEIRRDREAVAALGAEAAAAAGRLPGLLAYETRVERAREWPFDTPTLRRFAIVLLLPLASWLGGALVERGVDRFLD